MKQEMQLQEHFT